MPLTDTIFGMTTQPPTAVSVARVTFWGAARTVTGSMHLVEVGSKRVLLDCGLFQGKRAEAFRRNREFPFRPRDVDAVVISHAHIDHCGNLPNLCRSGFAGPIYCTPATRDLVAIMLADSAKIQEEDALYLNRKREKGEPRIEPLYEPRYVPRVLRACRGLPYDQSFDVCKGVEATFVEAGHLLGSAMIALRVEAGGQERRITFTGDIGRRGTPILRDPAPVPACDLLISECTYGGRRHEPVDLLAEQLGEVVQRTAQRGGKLLIPAFSLGRTQTVVYFLHQLMKQGRLVKVPVVVDSPLAAEATEVFRVHPECFDDEMALLLQDDPDLFGGRRIRYVRSVEESKELNGQPGPMVIIAASGMCEAGRILHHLKHNIEDERNTVLIVGYQAPETLGHRLVTRQPEVRILDRRYKVRAEVVVANGFSSHADHEDLMTYLGPLAGRTKKVRLVHGEPEHAAALAAALREKGMADVAVPERGEMVEVG
jgi:metallo-beta-lactamase family protein